MRRWTNLTLTEIRAAAGFHIPDDDHFKLQPACATFPMGFAWSSAVAQSYLVKVCADAGLTRSRLLARDVISPASQRVAGALATDDIMIFTTGPRDTSCTWAARVDRALGDAGVARSVEKDLTAVRDGTCIGVELEGGRWWSPPAGKLAQLLRGLLFLFGEAVVTPRGLKGLLGHASWLALLNRPLFACFGQVYRHGANSADLDDPVEMEPAALGELWLFACLTPCLDFDMARGWQTTLLASDATPTWGFGVSAAPAPPSVVAAVGRYAARRDIFVRLPRAGDDPFEQSLKERIGCPLPVPLARSAFKTVISSKCRFPGHAGALEAEAGVLAVRWLLRSAARHGRRTVLLLDAKAVLGSFAKGRSSAPSLERPTRRLAAHLLAGELSLKVVYVPSEDNAADDPSRGRVRRWRGRRVPVPARASHGAAADGEAERSDLRFWSQAADDVAELSEAARAVDDPDIRRYFQWLADDADWPAGAIDLTPLNEFWRQQPRRLRRREV